jgi:hypothetical protein
VWAFPGIELVVQTPDGKKIPLYRNSYALVIGNGNYSKGWDPLPGALKDADEVAAALKKQGFEVLIHKDLSHDRFQDVLNRFAVDYGGEPDNQLLIYYAGHGHTEKMANEEELGYLVMVDTPEPAEDLFGFRRTSVNMQTVITLAKMIRSKHVLFIFDSCFSGTVLNLRNRVVPKVISDRVRYPVRQFITAGRENEPVPDRSVFKEAFLNILEGRDMEPIQDGYLTGEELGLFLKNKVPLYNPAQHPQYGKIRDPRLDQGDFVFVKKEKDELAQCKLRNEFLRHQIAALKKQIPMRKTTLSVDASLPAFRVLVDGREIGRTPLTDVEIAPGEHSIRLEKKNHKPYLKWITMDQGKSLTLYFALAQEKAKKGRLFVELVPPNARVKILNIKSRFYQGIALEPGEYDLEASAKGHETTRQSLILTAGEEKKVTVRLKPKIPSSPQRVSGKPKALKSIEQITLAVLPWELTELTRYRDLCFMALKDAIRQNESYVPVYSHYDIGRDLNKNKIYRSVINNTTMNNLWTKKGFLSHLTPNVDFLCKLGKQLQVDAILVASVDVTTADPDRGSAKVFLVQVETKKEFKCMNESDDFDCDCYNYLLKCFNKVFVDYKRGL